MDEDRKDKQVPTGPKVIIPNKTEANELPLRESLVVELLEKLALDGAPTQVLEVYRLQFDLCCAAFETGRRAAQRLLIEKKITQEQLYEVTMEFTRFVSMSVNLAPNPQETMNVSNPAELMRILKAGLPNKGEA